MQTHNIRKELHWVILYLCPNAKCKTIFHREKTTETYLLVGTNPKLGIGHIRVDLIDDARFQGEPCNSAIEATDAPRIILDGRAEGNDCVAGGR